MNNMTILGLSSFSKPDAVVQINYLKFLGKLLISNIRPGSIKLLTNTADYIKNKNMSERSLRKKEFLMQEGIYE